MKFDEWNKLLTHALIGAYQTDFHPISQTRETFHAEGFTVSEAVDLIAEDHNLPYVELTGEVMIDDDGDPGDMDGDHESALASAGWGTDEDYGGGDERL